MAKIKIILEKGETEREAEDALLKAITSHNSGEVHTEGFDDPAMNDVTNRMEEIHNKIYQEMLEEINEALDSEYRRNGNQ
jgi:hypothetical protein